LDTLKVNEIKEARSVNLAYADPDAHRYISISGKAKVIENREKMKELWRPSLLAWFPEGLRDPQIGLIQIKVETAEIWDAPPSKIVHAMGIAKAIISGEPYDQRSQSEHLDLRH
jgi:general stress protein 26